VVEFGLGALVLVALVLLVPRLLERLEPKAIEEERLRP
jgi:hypothetical protein